MSVQLFAVSPKPTTMFIASPLGSTLGWAVFRSPLMLSVYFSWALVASVVVSILYVPLTDSVTANSSEPSALDGNTFTVALSVKPAGVVSPQAQLLQLDCDHLVHSCAVFELRQQHDP